MISEPLQAFFVLQVFFDGFRGVDYGRPVRWSSSVFAGAWHGDHVHSEDDVWELGAIGCLKLVFCRGRGVLCNFSAPVFLGVGLAIPAKAPGFVRGAFWRLV